MGGHRTAYFYGTPWPEQWGIGKVIANAERIPIVLPMFAWGNNAVLPQGRDNNLLPEVGVAVFRSGAWHTILCRPRFFMSGPCV